MKLQMVGCSHHNASVEVRERLAFSPDQAAMALGKWRQSFPTTEAVLLSTCNRVELYTAADDPAAGPSDQQVKQFLADFHGLQLHRCSTICSSNRAKEPCGICSRVAASLDSMVLGEPQILAQVKQAYQLAMQQESIGPITHEMFQRALRVAKRVATETSINEKRVSIASVAVTDFARNVFERFDDKQVLVIGAGETAEETLVYLQAEGARQITDRQPQSQCRRGAGRKVWRQAAAWERAGRRLIEADFVVSTTGATQPIVTLERFRRIEPRRYQRPLFVLDLAVPRDFDPAIGDCLGVYLYSLDDLQERLPAQSGRARQRIAAGAGHCRRRNRAFHARAVSSRHRADHPAASPGLAGSARSRIATAVQQAAGARRTRARKKSARRSNAT